MSAWLAYRRALAAEWVRWRTVRSTVALTVLIVAVTAMTAALLAATELTPEVSEATLAYALVCLAGAMPIGLVPTLASLGGVFASGQDDRFQMAQPAWLLIPRRGAIAAARCSVLAAWAAVVAAAAAAIGYLVARLWPSTSLAVPWSPELASVAMRYVLLCALSAVFGAALAGMLRNTTAAVAVLVVVPLIIEPALTAALRAVGSAVDLGAVGRYFPFAAAQRFADFGGGGVAAISGPGPWLCGGVFAGWVALACAGWLIRLRRRDV